MLWYGGYGQNPHGIYLSGREMGNITVKQKSLKQTLETWGICL